MSPAARQLETVTQETQVPVDMADPTEKTEKTSRYDEAGSSDERPATVAVEEPGPPRLQPPELIRNMTPEERHKLEIRLKRKVDARLLPAVIIMYILNYIDRCVQRA